MNYPVTVGHEGIKIQPENMEVDKIYYCIFEEKIMLFFKDQNELLNCYEIDEKEIVDEVKQSNSEDIESILQKYIEKKDLNH
ncbi:MAG: hypothetical protein ACREA3_05835 [Nitrosotalea sp.]